jgi:alpha-tubulin suppressor-like RCC1 family protein
LSNIVAIAAKDHVLALRCDGTVVAWGDNSTGAATVPDGLSNVTAVAVGGECMFGLTHGVSLALKNDGTVVAWGAGLSSGAYPSYGEAIIPAGLSNVVAIAAGGFFSLAAGDAHSLALKGDGSVVAWGLDDGGETEVPPGLGNVVAIAASGEQSMAISAGLQFLSIGVSNNSPVLRFRGFSGR